MYSYGLRKIGVGGRQSDEQVESLMKCRTETAEFYWDAQGAENGFL
jgi:hypothetical protein